MIREPPGTYWNGTTLSSRSWRIARQREWTKAAKTRKHYKGAEKGVDETTTKRWLTNLKKKNPMKAGALITVLADGVWAPDRAFRHGRRHAGDCVMCGRTMQGWSIFGGIALPYITATVTG